MTRSTKQSSSNVFMVFGQTGNGKSTLIKLFCGDNAPSSIIGHSVESKTKDTSFFNEKDSDNKLKRIWIDTMGTSDSSDKISNEDILRKVMAKMYTNHPNGFNVKVIWVVKKDCRKSKDLQIEAKFINSLSQYSTSSIWGSTIIIVKEGKLSPKKGVKGALAAAADFYNDTTTDDDNNKLANINAIGYTMLSVLDKDDDTIEGIEEGDISDKYRLKQGLLWDNEIKEKICSLLDNKTFITVTFKKECCIKCGITGDSRFVPTQCHRQFEKKHGIFKNNDSDSDDEEKTNEFCHTGKKAWRHLAGEKCLPKHTQHIGYLRHKSSSTRDEYCGTEHSGYSSKDACYRGHTNLSDRRIVKSGTYKCTNKSCKRKLKKDDNFYYCYGCNDKVVCEYSCIKQVNGEATFRKIYRSVHACCGSVYPSTNYCKPEWLCCGNDTHHPGCKKEWTRCGKNEKSKGCQQYWTCCDEPVKGGIYSEGCKYSCCKKSRKSKGCKKICKQCKKLYGTGPGCCTENVVHRYKN